jgi:hypothetical protein
VSDWGGDICHSRSICSQNGHIFNVKIPVIYTTIIVLTKTSKWKKLLRIVCG